MMSFIILFTAANVCLLVVSFTFWTLGKKAQKAADVLLAEGNAAWESSLAETYKSIAKQTELNEAMLAFEQHVAEYASMVIAHNKNA